MRLKSEIAAWHDRFFGRGGSPKTTGLIVAGLVTLVVIVGCGPAPVKSPDADEIAAGVVGRHLLVLTDETTGCQYLVRGTGHPGSLTPRLDEHGQPGMGCRAARKP